MHDEPRAPEGIAPLDLDPPAMLHDDLLHDRESETGAVLLRREVRVEDPRARFDGDPRAVIVDHDRRALSLAPRAHSHVAEDLSWRASLSRVADRLDGVAHHVDEDAPEHLPNDGGGEVLLRDLEPDVDVLVAERVLARGVLEVRQLVGAIVQELAQRRVVELCLRQAREVGEISHEAAGTHYAPLASSTGLVESFGDLIGRQLVSGGPRVERELISRVRTSLLSAFDGQLTHLEGVVVMRAEPAGMSADQSEASAAFESGLLAGVAAAGVSAVGVELGNTEPSQIPWYRGKGISSVDDLDDLAGQAALDYALAGDRGTFGIKATADSLLPSATISAAQP